MITVICSHCGFYDKNPNLEINFKEGQIYYMCPECRKESSISIIQKSTPLPKTRRM